MNLKHLGGFGSAFLIGASVYAVPINSPTNDLLLSKYGGVADINGDPTAAASYSTTSAPSNLNDGNRDGNYYDNSVSHSSGSAAGQYMEVTLPAAVTIGQVIVFNRTDCCGSRLDGGGNVPYSLEIFNGVPSAATLVYSSSQDFTPDLTDTNISGQTLTLPAPVQGNVVRIVQNNNDFMELAELEAYVPEPASLGLAAVGALGLLARRRV